MVRPPARPGVTPLRTLLAATLVLLATPFGVADPANPGVPDAGCQDPFQYWLHDYGGPALGHGILGRHDGNLVQCGTSSSLLPDGSDCRALREAGASGTPAYVLLCEVDRPMAYDGHAEYAIGGAFLAAEDGDGQTWGSRACLAEIGHHPFFPDVRVEDLALGQGASFVVTADHSRPGAPRLPGVPDCGDNVVESCHPGVQPPEGLPSPADLIVGEVAAMATSLAGSLGAVCNPDDRIIDGVGSVNVPFLPGADGSYHVLLCRGGTQGHIRTDIPRASPGVSRALACLGHHEP